MAKVANLSPLRRGRENRGQVGALEFREGIGREEMEETSERP